MKSKNESRGYSRSVYTLWVRSSKTILISSLVLVFVLGINAIYPCLFFANAKGETNNGVDADEWPEVAALGLSNSTMLDIYNYYEKAFETYPEDFDEGLEYEEQVTKEVSEKYGISGEQADLVYGYVMMNYEKVANDGEDSETEYTIQFGELLSVIKNGSIAVVKAKIGPSGSNDLTIKQNYFNICDMIKNQGLNIFDEVQYWAVADMTDGSEGKVISFTVPKRVIDLVSENQIPENKLGEYVDDLWILPSLMN